MDAKDFVGKAVLKHFEGYKKPFKGVVDQVKKIHSHRLFHIVYEDGDAEDVTRKELLQILVDGEGDAGVGQPQAPPKRKADIFTTLAPLAPPAASRAKKSRSVGEDGAGPSKAAPEGRAGAATPQGTAPPSPTGGGRGHAAAADRDELPGIMANVAARGREVAVDLARYAHKEAPPAGGASSSRAVACGPLLFVGDISPYARGPSTSGGHEDDDSPEHYRRQARRALADLDAVLREAGSARGLLVRVEVKLKDTEVGQAPWVAEWNEWVGAGPAPAVCMCEAFMGSQDNLVSISAVAGRPTDQLASP